MAMGPLTLDNSGAFSRQTQPLGILNLPKVEPAATVESVLKGMQTAAAIKKSLFDQPRQEARQEFLADRKFQRLKQDEPAIYERGLRVGEAKDKAYLSLIGPQTDLNRRKIDAQGRLLGPATDARLGELKDANNPEMRRLKAWSNAMRYMNFGRSSTPSDSYGVMKGNDPTTTNGPTTDDDAYAGE
jgi:hypothetical protein